MLIFLLLSSFIGLSFSTLGIDLSTLTSTTAWNCLRQNGYSFAIPRGYQSTGRVDPNVISNIRGARAAGFPYVDVYLFPCVPCGNPATQIGDLMRAVASENVGMIWIDVERHNWNANLAQNQQFISAMIAAGESAGRKLGIYTNYNNWQAIVGINWSGASHLPFWYAHYDNDPSFSDFRAFGGWSTPSIKQYVGDTTVCGVGVDLNWYP